MEMNLVEIIETPGNTSNFGIYELSKTLSKKYGGEYFLTQGIIRDRLLADLNKCDDIIHRALYGLAGYDDIYTTKLEAHMAAKLVCQQIVINGLRNRIKELAEYPIADISWDLPKDSKKRR